MIFFLEEELRSCFDFFLMCGVWWFFFCLMYAYIYLENLHLRLSQVHTAHC